MKTGIVVFTVLLAHCIAAAGASADAPMWQFDRSKDTKGWTIAPTLSASVMGGSMRLRANLPADFDYAAIGNQMFAPAIGEIDSPRGLNIPNEDYNKIIITMLNQSPETDGLLFWRHPDNPQQDAGVIRFTMKPYCKEWQQVTVHIDGAWGKPIDQIRIRPIMLARAGEMWISSIRFAKGDPRPKIPRPDVCSAAVVPVVQIPGITQADFADAFKVLDECLITNVPVQGFPSPVMGPGGAYGENWWQLDSGLNIIGTKWANPQLAEQMCRGFAAVQALNPDGRIDLWGSASVRGTVGELSSTPRLFEAAYDVARRSGDIKTREDIYVCLKGYLDWWLSPVKRDAKTKLITAIAEESLGADIPVSQTCGPVDTNMAVIIGCRNVSQLARSLGQLEQAKYYETQMRELQAALNRYCWSEQRAAYFNVNVHTRELDPQLICTTFDTMRLNTAPQDRVNKMIPQLLDPKLFNWGGVCITSLAKTDPRYVEATGPYDGRAWWGDIWTMRNLPIIDGLKDEGRHDLASELNWMTIKQFNKRWTEYLHPTTGSGEGVQRYGWSASQWIQCVVENLFGVDYDQIANRLRVFPQVPMALNAERLSISKILLPNSSKSRLSVSISPDVNGSRRIDVVFTGPISVKSVEIVQPAGYKVVVDARTGKAIKNAVSDDLKSALVVRLPASRRISVRFVK